MTAPTALPPVRARRRPRANAVPPLGPMAYWQRHGSAHCARLAQAAGTSYGYWKQIANQRKRPSIELARRLVQASGGELSLELLLFPISEQRLTGAAPLREGNKVGSAHRLRQALPSPSAQTSAPASASAPAIPARPAPPTT